MAEAARLWVRLKPYNERKGNLFRRFTIYGMRFEEARGWYIIPEVIELANGLIVNLGEKLRQIRNINDDPDSALAFDVMTEEQAKSLDEAQRKEAEERKAARDAARLEPVMDMVPLDQVSNPETTKRRPGRPRKVPVAGV